MTPKPYDLHMQYVFGWGDGAGGRSMNTDRAEHLQSEMSDAYIDGYVAGQAARGKAHKESAERLGVKLSPIRPMH
jgi:hypothetical protein